MHCTTLVWGWAVIGLLSLLPVQASVTVYNTNPYSMTSTASAANYTAPAYSDSTNLTAPTLPNPLPATNFALQVGASNTSQGGLSIPIPGTFYGFSVEMSVADQVCEFISPICPSKC